MSDSALDADTYDHEFIPGSIKGAIRATGAKTSNMVMVPFNLLVIDEQFNIRIADAKREEDIERLVDLIIANGYMRHNPMSGYASLIDGKHCIILTGGFTRYEAVKRAIERGYPIAEVPVVLKPAGTNMIDLTVALDVDNKQTPLRPYERAIVVKRLHNFGLSEKDIAVRLGVSIGHIKNLLYLISLPVELRQLVVRDVYAANYVVEKAREMGPEAALQLLKHDLDYAVLEEVAEEPDHTEQRERPPAPQTPAPARGHNRRPGSITAKAALFAVDHGLELADDDPELGMEWLRNWRQRDEDTVAEFDILLQAARSRRPAPPTPPAPLTRPTPEEVKHDAEAELIREGRRLDRVLGPAEPDVDI